MLDGTPGDDGGEGATADQPVAKEPKADKPAPEDREPKGDPTPKDDKVAK